MPCGCKKPNQEQQVHGPWDTTSLEAKEGCCLTHMPLCEPGCVREAAGSPWEECKQGVVARSLAGLSGKSSTSHSRRASSFRMPEQGPASHADTRTAHYTHYREAPDHHTKTRAYQGGTKGAARKSREHSYGIIFSRSYSNVPSAWETDLGRNPLG